MSRFVCIMSNLAVLLSLCASTARADAPGNIYVSALQKSGGTAFGASLASAAGLPYANDAMFFGCPSCKKANASGIYGTGTLLRTARAVAVGSVADALRDGAIRECVASCAAPPVGRSPWGLRYNGEKYVGEGPYVYKDRYDAIAPLLLALDTNAVIIFLVRHPVSHFRSLGRWAGVKYAGCERLDGRAGARIAVLRGDNWYAPRSSIRTERFGALGVAVAQWKDRARQHLDAPVGKSVLARYEDFCADPIRALADVLARARPGAPPVDVVAAREQAHKGHQGSSRERGCPPQPAPAARTAAARKLFGCCGARFVGEALASEMPALGYDGASELRDTPCEEDCAAHDCRTQGH